MKKSKHKNGLLDRNWSPIKFEEVADEVDKRDSELGGGTKVKHSEILDGPTWCEQVLRME